MRSRLVVVPHCPSWAKMFELEAKQVAHALGVDPRSVHHIGSTAVPGLYAKPIIDMLVVVDDVDAVDELTPAMTRLSYETLGEFGIAGRRYFRKCTDSGTRTHHVHVFECGSDEVERHLLFRDFMRTHDDWADQYSALKRTLAEAHPDDIDKYMDGKDAFIKEIDRHARAWASETRSQIKDIAS